MEYRDVLKDDESLRAFLGALRDFNEAFCKAMVDGVDYTLKLEIHGASGKLVHCRVNNDNFSRPRITGKNNKNCAAQSVR
jgi:hypothetical protein